MQNLFHEYKTIFLGKRGKRWNFLETFSVYCSTGASDRSFYPIFNKRFDHLEILLTICRPKNILSAGSLCGPYVPSPQSKCSKRTFMLPQTYHVSVSSMLSKLYLPPPKNFCHKIRTAIDFSRNFWFLWTIKQWHKEFKVCF